MGFELARIKALVPTHPATPNWARTLPDGLVMTLALAFLSYHFFEFPMLRLKDRFTSSGAGRVLAVNSSDTSEIAARS